MLEFIRTRAQSWIAWIIVGFIVITFALWGVSNYLTGAKEQPVAEVNGVAISKAQVHSDYLRQRQRLQEMLGENFRPDLFPEQQMKQRIVQELIERELIVGAAGEAGFRISDKFLVDFLHAIPQFQESGRFSNAAYERALRLQGMMPGYFEQMLRRDLVAQQYIDGIMKTEFVTSFEEDQYQRLQNQKRDIGYIVVPLAHYMESVVVENGEIEKYYNENSQRYRIPEQVSIDYLELNIADIQQAIEVSDDELRSRYESQKLNYRTPEERRARHILITLDDDADEQAVKAAEDKLNAIRERVAGGESFADLAREFSQDPGSAKDGGDLGFFGLDVMDETFEKTAFALQKGEVSVPVRSAFGMHLIKLEDIRGGETKSFDEVSEQLRQEIRREQAEQRFFDKAELLANLTYEHPDTLETAASELDMQVKQTMMFSRQGGEGIAANPKIVGAAFSEDVLNGGNNSEVVELDNTHLVVLRVNEHQEETAQPLEQVSEDIRADLKVLKAREAADKATAYMLARLKEGEAPQQLAEEVGTEWAQVEALERQAKDTELDPAIIMTSFRMPRPAAEGVTVYERVNTRTGDYALIGLSHVVDGDAQAEAASAELAKIRDAYSEAAYIAALSSLRARGDIAIQQ